MNTICAISTAQGGAIGIIRVSGPMAIEIVNGIFSRNIIEQPANKVILGNIINPNNEKEDNTIDEVLVTIFRAPHSYTGEDSVEIACHGSSYILQTILQILVDNGCQLAKPGEYTQRAFLNGKMDLSQAEAVADLISSQNAITHRIAMQQMKGTYSSKLQQLRNQLLQMTSLLELELDFSEEDVEFADRKELLQLSYDISSEIQRLTDSFAYGNAIKNGIPVAIIGAPNVGKSTLLNQLLHEEKAIVSDIQGTTRDTIEDTIHLKGIQFRFIDTAGIRHTTDSIEQLGIQRSIKAAEKATIIILLTEPGVSYPEIPIRNDQHVIKIVNKTQYFQALTGVGVPQLEEQLLSCVPKADNSDLLVTNLRHYEALKLAQEDIKNAQHSLQQSFTGDLVAEDLRLCLHHLSSILGSEITSDEVLGNIFSNFCIGK